MQLLASGALSGLGYVDLAMPTGYEEFALVLGGYQVDPDVGANTGPVSLVFSNDGNVTWFNDYNNADSYRQRFWRAEDFGSALGQGGINVGQYDEQYDDGVLYLGFKASPDQQYSTGHTARSVTTIYPGATGVRASVVGELHYTEAVSPTQFGRGVQKFSGELMDATGRMNGVRVMPHRGGDADAPDGGTWNMGHYWLYGRATP